MARVKILNDTRRWNSKKGDHNLAFQYCEYIYDNGESEKGYRFIWITPEGNLLPARGQTRIPSTCIY